VFVIRRQCAISAIQHPRKNVIKTTKMTVILCQLLAIIVLFVNDCSNILVQGFSLTKVRVPHSHTACQSRYVRSSLSRRSTVVISPRLRFIQSSTHQVTTQKTTFQLWDDISDVVSSSSSSSKSSDGIPADNSDTSSLITAPPVSLIGQELENELHPTQQQKLVKEGEQQTISDNVAVSIWPCGDELDKKLIKLSTPVIINNAINPLIGAVDLFWISRMGIPLAIAGQAAANQIFNSVFWLTSFLPNVSATLISKEHASNNQEAVTDAICQALFIGIGMALIPTIWILSHPHQILSTILPDPTSPALKYAIPYLFIRAFAFVPSLISIVGFSAFRGTMDTVTPVKISLFANLFNMILDPILIFSCAMGVTGAAIATLAAEIVSCIAYLYLLRKKQLIPNNLLKIFKIPSWKRLQPLVQGGAALQLRNVALNLTFLMVARVTQGLDTTHGIVASAHALAIQIFQLGGIVLLALSIVAQTIIPNDIITNGIESAQRTSNRLLSWGLIAGGVLGIVQILIGIPLVQRTTPLQSVRDAAVIPAVLGSMYQLINGLVFVGEGIMIGCGSFLQLSLHSVIATIGCLWALQTLPNKYGLTGVWLGFGVFNIIRLAGVAYHQFITGPLASRNNKKLINTTVQQPAAQ
jgi:multidrug resistance protein, MATE family